MSVISNAKEIADIIKKIGDVELYRKIIELEGEIIEITREKYALDGRVQELINTLKVKEKMKFKQPFYYQDGDDVPFCPNCWETNNVAIHMIVGSKYHAGIEHSCPSCKTEIYA